MTRRTDISHTQIEAHGAKGDGDNNDFKFAEGSKDGIVLTTKTEVSWQEAGRHGISTESLV